MTDENEVRELLAAVAPPPSRVSIEQAVRDGRGAARRRRYASLSAVAAVVAALAAVPVSAGALRGQFPSHNTGSAPPPSDAGVGTVAATGSGSGAACKVSALPLPKGVTGPAEATAVDPTGRYIAGSIMAGKSFQYTPILWTDGKPQVLPTTVYSAQVTGVNEHGVVVGTGFGPATEFAFRYVNGKVTQLELPAGYRPIWDSSPDPGAANPSVNGNGDVVATAVSGSGTNLTLRWRLGSSTGEKLNLPSHAEVAGINDAGTMVGEVYSDRTHPLAYAWDAGGTGHELSTPDGYRSMAYAIRGDWAVGVLIAPDTGGKLPLPSTSGYLPTAAPHFQVVLWNVRTGARTAVYEGTEWGISLNSARWVVISDFGTPTTRSALLRAGQAATLDRLGPGTANKVWAASDGNLAVGSSTAASGATPAVNPQDAHIQPVAWHC